MHMEDTVREVVDGSASLTLVTLNADGTPHPIVAGSGKTAHGDRIVFGIYKMENTRKNLAVNPRAWVVAATTDGKPKGYRLIGTAVPEGKKLIFNVDVVERLI